jgi:hypothetical protein
MFAVLKSCAKAGSCFKQLGASGPGRFNHGAKRSKSFLVLFFKKELLVLPYFFIFLTRSLAGKSEPGMMMKEILR